jgi:hypothetical protein
VTSSSRWRTDAPVLDSFTMGCKPAHSLLQAFAVVATWVAGASLAQGIGADLGRGVREMEERIEMRLRGQRAPADPQQAQPPERPPQDQSIEPWELVKV